MAMYRQKPISYGWIVLLIIICFPVGIAVLIYRIHTNKNIYYEDGNSMTKLGVALMVGALLALQIKQAAFITFALGIVGLLVGACCLLAGMDARRKSKRFHRYALVVENTGSARIEDIAAAMGVSYTEAEADLTKMVEKGYFMQAYIDQKTKEFIVVEMPADSRSGGKNKGAARQKRVVCASCGAATTVTAGRPAVCSYCDSPLDME
jgi:hypothetical protein